MTKKQRMIELIANPEEVDEEKIVAETAIMEERWVLVDFIKFLFAPGAICISDSPPLKGIWSYPISRMSVILHVHLK